MGDIPRFSNGRTLEDFEEESCSIEEQIGPENEVDEQVELPGRTEDAKIEKQDGKFGDEDCDRICDFGSPCDSGVCVGIGEGNVPEVFATAIPILHQCDDHVHH